MGLCSTRYHRVQEYARVDRKFIIKKNDICMQAVCGITVCVVLPYRGNDLH
jgi:hypothetical protein